MPVLGTFFSLKSLPMDRRSKKAKRNTQTRPWEDANRQPMAFFHAKRLWVFPQPFFMGKPIDPGQTAVV